MSYRERKMHPYNRGGLQHHRNRRHHVNQASRNHNRNRGYRHGNRMTNRNSQLERTRRRDDSSKRYIGRQDRCDDRYNPRCREEDMRGANNTDLSFTDEYRGNGNGGLSPKDMRLRSDHWSEQSQRTPDYLAEDLSEDVDDSSPFTDHGSSTTETRNPGNWSEDRNNCSTVWSRLDSRGDWYEENSPRGILKYSDNQRRMSNTPIWHSGSFEDDHLRRSHPRQIREDDEDGNIDVAAHVMRLLMDFGGSLEVSRLERELSDTLSISFHKEYNISRFLRRFKSQFTVVASRFAEEGEVGMDQVEVRTNLELCMTHSGNFKTCNGDCFDLHVCKFFILSECKSSNCKFGHSLHTEHNTEVLRRHGLHYLGREHLATLLKKIENRRGITIPLICKYYNSIGCKKENCPFLHICQNLDGCPSSMICRRNHWLIDNQPAMLLSKYGLDPTTQESDIFSLLHVQSHAESVLPFTRYCDSKTSLQKLSFGASSSPELPTIPLAPGILWSIESDQEDKIELNDIETSDMERIYTKYLEAKQQWIKIAGKQVKVDFSKFTGVLVYKSKNTNVQLHRKTKP